MNSKEREHEEALYQYQRQYAWTENLRKSLNSVRRNYRRSQKKLQEYLEKVKELKR